MSIFDRDKSDMPFVIAAGLTVAYFVLILPKKVLATMVAGVVSLITLSFLQQRKIRVYEKEFQKNNLSQWEEKDV